MAAHLHDSVLQSLALIQRAPSAREMATLARLQERELRNWLYGRTAAGQVGSIESALDAVASRVESRHHVKVETVVVGDIGLNDRLRALVSACSEAVENAAKHSGAGTVAVFVEVGADAVMAFVRDGGSGFDLDAIAPDRGGIAQSITGRLERQGGSATIVTAPGTGTEIQLRLPLNGLIT